MSRSRCTREDGASALEFALVAPLIVMLIWAMVELGGLANTKITLTHAAREGVRVYALGSGDPQNTVLTDVPGATVTTSGCPNPSNPGPNPGTATVQATVPRTYTLPTFGPPLGSKTHTVTVTGIARMRCGG